MQDLESTKSIKIYVMAHKAFEVPEDDIYIPVQVGAALHDDLGYQRDDDGDNISTKNPHYSELTGLYWMWKNGLDCDITGLCHYRRFFLNEKGEMFTADDYERILSRYDVIVPGRLVYPETETVYSEYAGKHYAKDLELTRNAIEKYYPEYLAAYDEVMNGHEMYFANMMVTSAALMREYAEWLFTVLFDVEKYLDMSGYDDYDRRVYGFISERLVYVWIKKNNIRVYETYVGLMGLKAETREVITKSADLLQRGEFNSVIEYLSDVNTKRPDLFFKDSDIDGDLEAIYMFAEIMAAEARSGKNNLISYSTDYRELKKLYSEVIKQMIGPLSNKDLFSVIRQHNLSTEFILLAVQKTIEDVQSRVKIYNYFASAYLDEGNLNMARIFVEVALREGNA